MAYFHRINIVLIATGALVACSGADTGPSSDDDATSSGAGGGGGAQLAEVCTQWLADRADLSEGSWSGDIASCQAGDIDVTGRENTLKTLNLYRALAALPAVEHDPLRNQKAQECALIQHANMDKGMLSHTPPSTWNCYTEDGAEASGQGNIATAPGVSAVDLYMVDPGNPSTLGHRRWILSNSVGPVGLGSTSEYSCMWVLGGANDVGKSWVAYPPPGDVPIALMQPFSWTSVDETGWSIQSDEIDLSNAQVSVTDDATSLPVTVTQLESGYGSTYALSFFPQGWESQAGHTYRVSVTGVTPSIAYDVSFVACQ